MEGRGRCAPVLLALAEARGFGFCTCGGLWVGVVGGSVKPRGSRDRSARGAGAGAGGVASASRGRVWWGRLALATGVPVVLLAALEGAARFAGYGWPTSYFVRGQTGDRPCWVENDRFGLQFFPRQLARNPPPTVMDLERPADGCRVYVLGESAAMGDPCPAFSMGRYLEVLLQARYPNRRVEVVTVAMTAINSHALLSMARDCARRGGDVWVLYLGNNEMVGPFGALDVLGPAAPPWPLVRARLALQRTALGQAAKDGLERWGGRSAPPGGWAGMEMFAGRELPPGDERRLRAYKNFERNLRDMIELGLRHGVDVLVSPAAVNLRDCPPFASVSGELAAGATPEALALWLKRGEQMEQSGDWEGALEAYEAAVAIAPRHAESHFRLGRLCLRLGRTERARLALEQACDLDALPFRADSQIRSVCRAVAERFPGEKVRFLDARAVLAARVADGVPGLESFYEHVHLKPSGNYALARAMAEVVESWLGRRGWESSGADWLSELDCGTRLGLTDWARFEVLDNVRRRLRQPPFTGTEQVRLLVREADREWQEVRQRLTAERAARAREILGRAVSQRPRDFRLHELRAQFLEATGDLAGAREAWSEVAQLIPHHHLGWFQEGRLLARLGRWQEAEVALRRAVRIRPELSEGWLELGQVLLQLGRSGEALVCFEEVRRLLPQDWRGAYQKGRALARMDRLTEAVEAFRLALRLNPEAVEPRYQLGEALAFLGQTQEARDLFQQVLEREPGHLLARINLGVALVRLGEWQAAAVQLRLAQQQAPGNPVVSNYLAQVESHLQAPR